MPFLVIRSRSLSQLLSFYVLQDAWLSARVALLRSIKSQIHSERVKVQNVM